MVFKTCLKQNTKAIHFLDFYLIYKWTQFNRTSNRELTNWLNIEGEKNSTTDFDFDMFPVAVLWPGIVSQAQLWKGLVEMPSMQVSSLRMQVFATFDWKRLNHNNICPKQETWIKKTNSSKPALLEGLEVDQFMWSIIQVKMSPNTKQSIKKHKYLGARKIFVHF